MHIVCLCFRYRLFRIFLIFVFSFFDANIFWWMKMYILSLCWCACRLEIECDLLMSDAIERRRIKDALAYWEELTCVTFTENSKAPFKLLFIKHDGQVALRASTCRIMFLFLNGSGDFENTLLEAISQSCLALRHSGRMCQQRRRFTLSARFCSSTFLKFYLQLIV